MGTQYLIGETAGAVVRIGIPDLMSLPGERIYIVSITTQSTVTDITPTTLTPEEQLRADLGGIELNVLTSYTLADAIREGARVTSQEYGWGADDTACALSAGAIAARARGYLPSSK